MMIDLLNALDPLLCEAIRIFFVVAAPILGLRIAFRIVFQGYSFDFWDLWYSFFSLFKKKTKEENINNADLNDNLEPKKVNLSKLANEPRGFFDDDY